jgi:hypothetical protein
MKRTLSRQLAELEQFRHTYGKGSARHVEQGLLRLRNIEFPDVESLIHFHDALLFLRAFPQSARVAKLAGQLLLGVGRQVAELQKKNADFDLFDDEEFSGIANTTLRDTPTYELARWLMGRFPHEVHPNWDVDAVGRQLSSSLPAFVPLLADDCLVEPDTPYLEWLSAAAGGSDRILPWLLQRIEGSSLPLLQKTAYYDALAIELEWELGEGHASRTHNLRQPAKVFVHREPLITRKQVSLDNELRSGDLPMRKLPPNEGEEALNMAREVLTVRYRELHGSTRADANDVYEAEVGRGVQLYIWCVPPQWRLPLRAYHAGFTLKNGVPVNYFEAISLGEWVEVGFNTFYAFREGETGWIYSKILHLLHQLTGVTCFSAYPYQLGHENEEAIKSGAFWFYRKLGFRPGRPELLALAEKEEARMARKPGYRSSPATLRKLAAHHAFYEFGPRRRGLWDTFSDRNIGFKVQKQMAAQFGSDPERMRQEIVAKLAGVIGLSFDKLSAAERGAFDNLAPVLNLIDDLPNWPSAARHAVGEVVRAKAGSEENEYLRQLQAHTKLRDALVRLGSAAPAEPAKAASAD